MPKKIEHHFSMKFTGIGCQSSQGLSEFHSALKQELADTLSTISGCRDSDACKLTSMKVSTCGWTVHEMTKRAVDDAMEVLFSLLVQPVESASMTDDVDEISEAVLFHMPYAISTGQFRISLQGSVYRVSSFKSLWSEITCNPGFVNSTDKTGCGKQQIINASVYKPISIGACATHETNLWLSPPAKQPRNPCSEPLPVYQDLSTRYDWPVKKPLAICQSR